MSGRREFLSTLTTGAALVLLEPLGAVEKLVARAGKHLEVAAVERTTVRMPYREVPERAMDRELPHWRWSEIFEVRLRSGHVGIGETLLWYTWRVSSDDDVARAIGKNAADLLWDDSFGAGLQGALLDAVGQALEVPVHRLLGKKVHDRTPLSWWNIDMPPADMAAECAEALRQGYLSYKTKGRPWFDLHDQIERSAAVVPDEFKIDMDFNETLLDARRAIPILKQLESYPEIDIYESPIPQKDIAGNRQIRDATRVKIALHYGTPPPASVVRDGVCDGFVVGGGASRVLRQGHFAAEVDLPFWLQLVGTDITAALSLHFGGVLSHARWPAVNCHQLYRHRLLKEPIAVDRGTARVPDKPGLGFTLDRDVVEGFRVEKPKERPNPPRLVETRWRDGRRMHFSSDGGVNFVLRPAMEGKVPFYERGVTTRLWPDDGSLRWRKAAERAADGPILVEPD